MTKAIHLNVLLPKNRDRLGWLKVDVDGKPVAEFRVLGRGSSTVHGKSTGNPTRNPLQYAGDTPTGNYQSTGIESTEDWPQASYGPWGAVQLKAVAGEALTAERLGRRGLLIHGGAQGRFHGYRSTKGCLRLSNLDMMKLMDILRNAGDDPQHLMTMGLTVDVHVRQW